jgi:hypothetical protein
MVDRLAALLPIWIAILTTLFIVKACAAVLALRIKLCKNFLTLECLVADCLIHSDLSEQRLALVFFKLLFERILDRP